MNPALIQERRRSPRVELSPSFEVNLRSSGRMIPVSAVNLSEGGMCVRLEELLEVRSTVFLQVKASATRRVASDRRFECIGRVAWVIQRLDLRATPPFLFDIGVEFTELPQALRRFLLRRREPAGARKRASASAAKTLQSWEHEGRIFVPRLERLDHHAQPWHLVVFVEGTPCFSGHYASARQALAAWATFKRQHTQR